MARWIGLLVVVLAVIAIALALVADEERPSAPPALAPAPTATAPPARPATTVAPARRPPETPTTVPLARPPAADHPIESPEDARRFLKDAEIDERELSHEVQEHMDRRFQEEEKAR